MNNKYGGFSIVEIIIACAIFLGTIAAFVAASDILRNLATAVSLKTEAALLLEEGAEAVMVLRDLSWETNIASAALETPHHLFWDGDSYALTEVETLIGGKYWRRVTFFEVYRDGTGAYAESGTVDAGTRRVALEIVLASSSEVLVSAEMLVHSIE